MNRASFAGIRLATSRGAIVARQTAIRSCLRIREPSLSGANQNDLEHMLFIMRIDLPVETRHAAHGSA